MEAIPRLQPQLALQDGAFHSGTSRIAVRGELVLTHINRRKNVHELPVGQPFRSIESSSAGRARLTSPPPKTQLNNAYSTDKPFLCFTAASELFLARRAAILSRNPADQGEVRWG